MRTVRQMVLGNVGCVEALGLGWLETFVVGENVDDAVGFSHGGFVIMGEAGHVLLSSRV